MGKIYHSLIELIGQTPLLEPERFNARYVKEGARLLLKLERTNPGGSSKDRVALALIEAAEQDGTLRPGGTIVEPTSGNTGIGLAWTARLKGYNVVLTMPETMSVERMSLLRALGARLELTPAAEGMTGAVRRADELCATTPGAVIVGQFDNPANADAHYRTTAEEIWADTDGHVDLLVAGVGTGGTLCGAARRLRELAPTFKAVAVEPAGSPVLSGGKAGPHKLQGIGAGFVPGNFDRSVVDEVVPVRDEDAVRAARALAVSEGLLVGISSGAALFAALDVARRPENKGRTVVVILPDTGERYLSTPLFDSAALPLDELA